jgi:hypothetical protein
MVSVRDFISYERTRTVILNVVLVAPELVLWQCKLLQISSRVFLPDWLRLLRAVPVGGGQSPSRRVGIGIDFDSYLTSNQRTARIYGTSNVVPGSAQCRKFRKRGVAIHNITVHQIILL